MREYSNWTLSAGRIAGVPVRLHGSLFVGAIFAVYIAVKARNDPDDWVYGVLAATVALLPDLSRSVTSARTPDSEAAGIAHVVSDPASKPGECANQ